MSNVKKKVKFFVEVECYEETLKDASRGFTIQLLTNGGDLSHLSAAERIGYQVARKYKETLDKEEQK